MPRFKLSHSQMALGTGVACRTCPGLAAGQLGCVWISLPTDPLSDPGPFLLTSPGEENAYTPQAVQASVGRPHLQAHSPLGLSGAPSREGRMPPSGSGWKDTLPDGTQGSLQPSSCRLSPRPSARDLQDLPVHRFGHWPGPSCVFTLLSSAGTFPPLRAPGVLASLFGKSVSCCSAYLATFTYLNHN